MAKRIILISSGPVFIALLVLAVTFTGIGRGQPAYTPADIEQAKSQIVSFIQAGKLAEAEAAVDKIMSLPVSREKGQAIQEISGAYQIANQYNKAIELCDYVLQNWPKEDFAVWAGMSMAFAQFGKGNTAAADSAIDRIITNCTDSAVLPQALLIVAEHYSWQKTFDRAERLYGIVIEKAPDSTWAAKARLGLTGVNVLALIENQQYSIAQKQADLMAADFNNQPELPAMLFHIGQEFYWKHQFTEAKDALDHIKNLPDNSFTRQAKLWSANANVCELIKQDEDKEVIAAIDKLIKDFEGDAGLPEVVYRISKEYEWKKGTSINRMGWYDTPNSIYQKLMQQFGDTSYGQAAELDQKRLSHRMKIFKLLKDGDQNQIDTAIETMVAELKGQPEVASELYWIACGYEEQPNKSEQAKQMYERIVKEYPGTDEADRAALDVQRRTIWDLIITGDVNTATALLDKFVADFGQNYYSGTCLGRAVRGFYVAGAEFKGKNQPEKAKQYCEIAANIWQRLPKTTLQKGMETAYLYLYVGANYLELRQWENAIENFQKLIDDYPDFEHACSVQTAMSYCYEKLRDSGDLPKEAVNPIIEETYKAILTNYPGCYATKEISYRMAGLMLEKGNKISASTYYKMFLQAANSESERLSTIYKGKKPPPDKRIETVQAKLIELTAEGGTN